MKRLALSLPGGGLSGALYQVGALAALEDGIEGLGEVGVYVGHASGSILAAALAGGISAERLYRALLDPADPFFPLERRHLIAPDLGEWERTITTAWLALRRALPSLDPRARSQVGAAERVAEQLDRLSDSLPAGLFTLDRFERFLAEFFQRRDIPNAFFAMPRALRVVAHDLDGGERVLFGAPGHDDVPVSLACAASCAMPLVYSPVRIGNRHYLDGGLCSMTHFDVAEEQGAEFTIVINPRVPVAMGSTSTVPTGHGPGRSVRDKGLMWVLNQSRRIASQAMLASELAHPPAGMGVLLLEPTPEDGLMFLRNARSFDARRALLEHAYRSTRARLAGWLEANAALAERLALRAR
jgi:NTE family protein